MPNRTARIDLLASYYLILFASACASPIASATDFFLTLGGGYDRGGNQASLEENVLFFQELLADKLPSPVQHTVFFADGFDQDADLQVLAEQSIAEQLPATDLLSKLHRRRGVQQVVYRNHRVPQIAGSLSPELVHQKLTEIGKSMHAGDRLIIYVTAHGSAGPRGDPFNTTIDCWNHSKISARQFSQWLDELPPESCVMMVMAQCYCGGFSHAIFNDLRTEDGITQQLRAGFFAQQHDLAAAGCRPDIEHDQEFSSYFWGAFAGKSRNGVSIADCDLNLDGDISFAEAYAYALVASETIDIPLKTSDTLLRTYSRLDMEPELTVDSEAEDQSDSQVRPSKRVNPAELFLFTGTLQRFVNHADPISGSTVAKLSQVLGFGLETELSEITKVYEENRRRPFLRGRGQAGGRRSSGRRQLLAEIGEKWPELADPESWMKSDELQRDRQETLIKQIEELPSWKAYADRAAQIEREVTEANEREMRAVKCRRLLLTLESIALAQNLKHFASPEIQARYRQMIELEDSTLKKYEPSQNQLP